MNRGQLLVEEKVISKRLESQRTIRIYLPPSYSKTPQKRFPVLYLHDGQNVFSPAGPHACFGWGNWELDKIVDDLSIAEKMREIIMVAVDNGRSRYQEYRGPATHDDDSRFEDYSAFLIKELKPKIDREYRTLRTAANTGVMGSSLGGICSLALAWDHSKTFGLAASLSGSFHIEKRHFIEKILRSSKRRRKPFRIYLDSGTIDHSGDDDGLSDVEEVASELRRIGWKDDVNLKHFTDPKPLTETQLAQTDLPRDKWHEAQSSQHNEFYWRMRVWRALVFLFPPPRNLKKA